MSSFESRSDGELLALTARDPEGFGAFYERRVRLVLGFLINATRDPEQALDLTAEVFAAALLAAPRFKPDGPPASAWLIGIARNVLAASRRKQSSAAAARRKLGMERRAFARDRLEGIEATLDTAEGEYLAALSELPSAERDAVTAHVIDERSYTEIARSEGAAPAAIRQRVSRGLRKLARLDREVS